MVSKICEWLSDFQHLTWFGITTNTLGLFALILSLAAHLQEVRLENDSFRTSEMRSTPALTLQTFRLSGFCITTVALEDGDEFVEFVESRRFGAVLHGHKHIPRIAVTPNGKIPVFGCGSSVGKVETNDRKPYLSVNVLSFEPESRRITCRLLAERMPGAGLFEDSRHEVIHIGGRPRITR
jgi:hypothetical protein